MGLLYSKWNGTLELVISRRPLSRERERPSLPSNTKSPEREIAINKWCQSSNNCSMPQYTSTTPDNGEGLSQAHDEERGSEKAAQRPSEKSPRDAKKGKLSPKITRIKVGIIALAALLIGVAVILGVVLGRRRGGGGENLSLEGGTEDDGSSLTTSIPTPAAEFSAQPTMAPSKTSGSNDEHLRLNRLKLNDALAKWESRGFENYDYQYRSVCFCPPEFVQIMAVKVRGGTIASASYAEDFNDGIYSGDIIPKNLAVPTIDGLFGIIESGIDKRVYSISVIYDDKLGYPVDISIDYDANIADEEFYVNVMNFVPVFKSTPPTPFPTVPPTAFEDDSRTQSEEGSGDLNETRAMESGDNDVIPYKLRTFSKHILDGYDSCDALKLDLTQAANHRANNAILRYADWNDIYYEENLEDSAAPASESATSASKEKSEGQSSGETSYGSNNQVDGVDEADIVKSDGTNVYSAYGDKVVVWEATTGNKIAEIKMPEPFFDDTNCKNFPYPRPVDVAEKPEILEESVDVKSETTILSNATNQDSISGKKSMDFRPGYPSCFKPRASVQKLLLHDDRLVVFVSGYNTDASHQVLTPEDRPIISNIGSVQMRIYDTSTKVKSTTEEATLPELKLVEEHKLPGFLSSARSVGSIAHAITTTSIDTHRHLDYPFARWNFPNMKKEEYIEAAKQNATETAIPQFVARIMAELKERHGNSCEGIAQISVFQTGDLEAETSRYNWWGNGIFGGLTSISSFDIDTTGLGKGIKTGAVFLPNTWGTTIYATSNRLFLASRGYESDKEVGYIENTLIYAFKLPQDASSRANPIGVGKVPGNVLNQFSLDFYEGHLRVATTVRGRSACVLLDEGNPTSSCQWKQIRGPINRITILKMPSDESGDETLMEVTGRTEPLGRPGESIFAVRFVENLGFVVTFERIDPFIIVDLSNVSEPPVVGELKISGFSNYLHPTGDGETIVAVGQNTDDDGRQTGLQLTLFSFENINKPTALARHTIDGKWSSSEVQWNHLAFRFLPDSWKVILPASAYGDNFFDGFYIFDVNKEEKEISEIFRVNLANKDVYYEGRCYYDGYLQARSMVFNGMVTLMKAHFVESYDLASDGTEAKWQLDLDKDLPRDQCVYNYWW